MNTEYLENFLLVIQCRSLAEAARRLHLTPGAVAARIRILEGELGASLIQRSGHTVKPTEAGLRIYNRAQALTQDVRDLRACVASGAPEGELRLGVFYSALTTHLPALLEKFCLNLHPELSILIDYDPSAALCSRVHSGQLDVALVIEPPFTLHKNCAWRTLQEEPLAVIAPLCMEGRDAHALLNEEPFIRYHRKAFSGQLVDRYLKDNSIFPRQRLEIDSLLTIVSLVERGVGVSLVPDSFSISYREHQLTKLSLPNRTPIRRIGMIWNKQGPRLALAQALVNHATQVFGTRETQ
ncbi:LysR substrate-binding domain-containing protein [Pollutimonas harenae]|uniref:LysR family transcriptional regulator n=1 Tax=Pollutimonas harenae TaxID=657015 RepID=A0A853GXI6_9BURK|nr:LysR substrate-binding domain-containing protein [Pollutimonas harenae]NYT84842.1 LysR family transcriptional regulator [Pollutimonas harenae]TEA72760.1 LysR family transcriptional regulator [Pollutimonas harenae]